MAVEQETIGKPGRSALRAAAPIIVSALAAGFVIWGVTLASEYLATPSWAEPLARALYRVAFMLRLPFIVLTEFVFTTRHHHVVSTKLFYFVTSFAAGFAWNLAIHFIWRRWRTSRSRGTGQAQPPALTAISRRNFIATSAVALPTALGGYSVLVEPQRVRLARQTIAIRDLPASLDGFRLIQISDTHYGPFVSLRYLRSVIEQANALQGDLVILTGDYVHHTPLAIGPGVDVLKHLKARLGVVATLGNHDHWEGAAAVRATFAEIRIPLIDNAQRFITRDALHGEPVPGSICLGGVGDLWEDKTDFARALANAPDAMPRIVLAHNPDTAEVVTPGTRIDLMCSGHTHGGQVWVPGFGTPILPSAFGQKYAGGLCNGPHCPVLVSRGVGMAIMPVRFGVPPEIGEITLRKFA